MATNYVMPKLAMGMNEGTVVEWLVAEGQQVERGAPLMQVETEKVAYDVEAPVAGWFHILVPAGETVPVESVIGQFAASAEEYAQLGGGAAPAAAGATPKIEFNDKLTSTGAVMARSAAAPAAAAPVTIGGSIKDSPPYLHDDRLLTLEDTVEFFNLVLALNLNQQEKTDLVAFMRAL